MNFVINGKVVSIDNEELKQALESNTEEIKIESNFKIRTQEEEDSFLRNVKTETVNTAMEMEVKKWRNEKGLDFEGKTMENLLNAFEANNKELFTKDPSRQIESKDNDIRILQANNKELKDLNSSIINDFKGYKNGIKTDNVFSKMIPKNSVLPIEDMVMLLKSKIHHEFDENGTLFFKDATGAAMKDDNLNYLGGDKIAENFFTSNPSYLTGASGGAGGGDSTGASKPTSMEAFDKMQEANGVNINSAEYSANVTKAMADGSLVA